MNRSRNLAAAGVTLLALSFLGMSGPVAAHGEIGEHVQHLQTHMGEYADNINGLIASVDSIVAQYEPGESYTNDLDALIQQWESVEFHEAVESRAAPLYPPIWSALGSLSSAVKESAAAATVEAKGDAIAAALWQGYGALKLLAARDDSGHGHEHGHEQANASGSAVIDTINDNLDQVLVLYKKDKNKAAQELIFNTYMNYFEGIEGDLIEQDAELVSELELDFNATLPQLIKNGAPAGEVADQIEDMQADLNDARQLLATAAQNESSVF